LLSACQHNSLTMIPWLWVSTALCQKLEGKGQEVDGVCKILLRRLKDLDKSNWTASFSSNAAKFRRSVRSTLDKICMVMTRLACNRAIESSYWRMDNDSDVGLLTGYVLYRLPVELEFMDLDTFPRWFRLRPSLLTSW
jgi:hypothetical protein